jgi:hypothetical protein
LRPQGRHRRAQLRARRRELRRPLAHRQALVVEVVDLADALDPA